MTLNQGGCDGWAVHADNEKEQACILSVKNLGNKRRHKTRKI
jgi:hypothetical protein